MSKIRFFFQDEEDLANIAETEGCSQETRMWVDGTKLTFLIMKIMEIGS
jgi:hypothetical protein